MFAICFKIIKILMIDMHSLPWLGLQAQGKGQ